VFIYLGDGKIIEAKGGCPSEKSARVITSNLKSSGGNYEKIYKYKKGDPNPGFFFFHLKNGDENSYYDIHLGAPHDCRPSPED